MKQEHRQTRRTILQHGTMLTAVAAVGTARAQTTTQGSSGQPTGTAEARPGPQPMSGFDLRQRQTYEIRSNAALQAARGVAKPEPLIPETTPTKELAYKQYSKALARDLGGADPALPRLDGFGAMRTALDDAFKRTWSGDELQQPPDFEELDKLERYIGGTVKFKFTNPLGGLSFDLEGIDAPYTKFNKPPAFESARAAAEMAEVYWLALLRDKPIRAFAPDTTDADVLQAIGDLNTYSWFSSTGIGPFTPDRLFRAELKTADVKLPQGFAGVEVGPYVSQFLLRGTADASTGATAANGTVGIGSLRLSQRQRTALPGFDYLFRPDTTADMEYLAVQGGSRTAIGQNKFDTEALRFIRSLRDGANFVHFDEIYQEYFIAASILLSEIPRVGNTVVVPSGTGPVVAEFGETPLQNGMLNPGNPYTKSKAQVGFATFGVTQTLTLLAEISTRAHKAAWYYKWSQRWLRPEEFGGRVHAQITRPDLKYGINDELISSHLPNGRSQVLARTFRKNQQAGAASYLLPMAFPEGCPTHPAHPSGHSTVAGAAVTILKAVFNERAVLSGPAYEASADGTSLVDSGSKATLTVGGELNKLASNVSMFRGVSGVHWRSDSVNGLLLGEQIAVNLLVEQTTVLRDRAGNIQVRFYRENIGPNSASFRFTLFSGRTVEIKDGTIRFLKGALDAPLGSLDYEDAQPLTFPEFVDQTY